MEQAKAASPRRHVQELDGIRGFAILAVMALHFLCDMVEPQHWFERVVSKIAQYGGWGVDLFFVLSGYLITGILDDTKGRENFFRAFYMRRTLRIFPLYYGVLVLLLVAIPESFAAQYAPPLLELRRVQGWLWTYLTNVHLASTGGFTIPYASHFWTLAIEEHFYLFWPFVVALTPRKTALRVCILLGAVALASRIALLYGGVNPVAAQVLTFCRLDALTAGAGFALAARDPSISASLGAKTRRWILPLAAAVLATSAWHAVVGSGDNAVLPLRGTLIALFFAAFVFLCDAPEGPAWIKAPLRMRWLVQMGKYSYGLYVFHGILTHVFHERNTLQLVTDALGSRPLALVVHALLAGVASLVVALLSYHLFEARFLDLKRLFEVGTPKPATAGEAQPPVSAPVSSEGDVIPAPNAPHGN